MSKLMNCGDVVGFVGGNNTRDAWPWLPQVGEHGAVMFRSELTGEDDQREVVVEMALGDTATDKTKKALIALVRTEDSDGPESQWTLAHSILKDGQQEACVVSKDENGLNLISGARRWFGNILANLLDKDHTPQFLGRLYEGTNVEEARNLGHQLNATHKALNPVDEGRRYYELKENNNWTDRQIAEHLSVFITGTNKPNIQRVAMYRKLHDEKITDAMRAKVAAGQATIDSALKVLAGKKPDVDKKKNRPRTMKYDTLTKIATPAFVKKLVDAKEANKEEFKSISEAVMYGMRIALGKEKLPAELQEELDKKAAKAKAKKPAETPAPTDGAPAEPEGAVA